MPIAYEVNMYMGCLIFAILFASRLRLAVHPVDWCPQGWSSQWGVLVYMHSPFEVINAIAVQYSINITLLGMDHVWLIPCTELLYF